MSDFRDISSDPAHRCFLRLGDDTRCNISINFERAVFPDDMEGRHSHDIHDAVDGTWEADARICNEELGNLLIQIGFWLKAKPLLQHLDHEFPHV